MASQSTSTWWELSNPLRFTAKCSMTSHPGLPLWESWKTHGCWRASVEAAKLFGTYSCRWCRWHGFCRLCPNRPSAGCAIYSDPEKIVVCYRTLKTILGVFLGVRYFLRHPDISTQTHVMWCSVCAWHYRAGLCPIEWGCSQHSRKHCINL